MTIYDLPFISDAWHTENVTVAFIWAMIGQILVQGAYYARGRTGSHPLYRAMGKHLPDAIEDPTPYFLALVAGMPIALWAGLSMVFSQLVQGFGVNWGIGRPFFDPEEEPCWKLPEKDPVVCVPKPSGYQRLFVLLAGVLLTGVSLFTDPLTAIL